jgi:hypothetical protein
MQQISFILKKAIIISVILSAILFQNCSMSKKIDNRWAVSRNVCKKLKDDVLVYVIFIDTKTTIPWSDMDMKASLDSIQRAIGWIHEQAKTNTQPLSIKLDYLKTTPKAIKKDLPVTISKELISAVEVTKINKWADNVSKIAGSKIETKSKDSLAVLNPKNTDRLIAKLRDEYNSESVCLLFILNTYKKDDFTVVLNTMSNTQVEYVINSYKNSSIIAYDFLKLFGAISLYSSPDKKPSKNKAFAKEQFADDIMVNPAEDIHYLSIGDFTKYMIGWTDEIDPKYERLFEETKKEK